MRRTALTALLLALALSATLATGAQAAATRSLCAPTAVLRESPNGFVIARLQRPQRFELRGRSANRRWALVVSRDGTIGWLPYRRLCRA